jgi:DNA repair exonuclease SbcCD ATPase subunit
MKAFFHSLAIAQDPSSVSQEGLPYWILWFLLCVILLLLTFIFLRDKDLRQRLNQFFFGAKKKLIRFRLHTRLKIAGRKKNEAFRELGQKVWEEKLEVIGAEKTSKTLDKLEEKKSVLQEDLENALVKISKLKKSLEEKSLKNGIKITSKKAEIKMQNEKLWEIRNRLRDFRVSLSQKKKDAEKAERELKVLEKDRPDMNRQPLQNEADKKKKADTTTGKTAEISTKLKETSQEIKELKKNITEQESEEKALKELIQADNAESKSLEETVKKEQDEVEKEINEWDRHKIRIQEKIQRIEKRKVPLFESLGDLADMNRIEHDSLMLFYSQIDRINQKIKDIERQLKELG